MLPFNFHLEDQTKTYFRCCGCKVYAAEVIVHFTEEDALTFCRTCLQRLRATLKKALKELPKLPKGSPMPDEAMHDGD